IEQAMTSLRAAGCRRIVVLPLYPHYSSSTTASIVDEIGRILRGLQHQPTVNIVPPYFDHPQFIDLLARSVRRAFPHRLPDHILVSNHGIPESMVRRGDPYSCQAKKTARLLQQTLGCNNQQMSAAFQSRFGAAEWVKPYSVARVKQLAESGLSHLAVIAPSFAVDCLETLEEINIGLREDFIHHHPTTSPLAATAHRQPQFYYIPCLNDEADVIDFYHQLILPYIS
ncbi:MAG: ferrochelatase, partial [Alphaproteobacteria bacterium]|nr:ferrochelatase [Alphaproteobacteria bacterium]